MTPTLQAARSPARRTSGAWAVLPALTLAVLGCAGRGGLHAPADGSDTGVAGNADVLAPIAEVAAIGSGGAGGSTTGTDAGSAGGFAGSAGGAVGSGGVFKDASVGGSSGDAMGPSRDTATIAETADAAGEAWQDAACDSRLLWDAITRGARGGYTVCEPYVPDAGMGWCGLAKAGYIVLDGDGRVVDNTSLLGEAKQLWLDGLSTMRWPCLSGQTLQFVCFECPI
jgi:hypothetical protein